MWYFLLMCVVCMEGCRPEQIFSFEHAEDDPIQGAMASTRTFRELMPKKQVKSDQVNGPYRHTVDDVQEKSPCAVIVVSGEQNYHNLQSLLRKYRYDSNGVLKPDSVQYFYKAPQLKSASAEARPKLVKLESEAFSPRGGFIRFYKEYASIPQHEVPY